MSFHRTSAALAAVLSLSLSGVAPATAAEVLSFTTSATPNSPQSPVFEAWAKMLEEKTDGELTVEFYYQQSLSKLADNLEAISSGLADIGIVVAAYDRSKLPLTYLSSTSFGTGDPYAVSQAWLETREKFPAIKEEEKSNNVKFLTNHSINATVLVGDKFFRTPQDMAGETMRLSSHYTFAARNEGIDVNAARIRSPETYTSLEKGTISGAVTYLGQIYPYKLNEVADHLTLLDLGQHMNMYYINRDRWESMTEEQRSIIEGSLPQLAIDLAKAELEYDMQSLERVQKDPEYPMDVLHVSSENREKWADALRPSYENNVSKAESVNPVAPEIGDYYISRINAWDDKLQSEGHPW
ncbi:MAG: TRAP transporter substrate-binding protein DctP [Pseudomonadota bacterium]